MRSGQATHTGRGQLKARLLHLLSCLGERHSDERRTQRFRVHFHTRAPQVIICPNLHIRRLKTDTETDPLSHLGSIN